MIYMTWKVPMHDLRWLDHTGISRVMQSGQYLHGEEVENFEKVFSEWFETKHADGRIVYPYSVAVNSGFDALQLILRAYDIGRDDYVLVPSFAPLPVWMAVSIVGAIPVPVEVSQATYNISRASLQIVLQKYNPRAIIAVHLFGRPCDIVGIRKDIIDSDFPECIVIEDCSQAHGAIADAGIKVGMFGDIAAFSFYPTKNLGALGDAGMVVTRSWAIADRIRELAYYGNGNQIGINSRMDEIQAAILRDKFSSLAERNQKRRGNASIYLQNLSDLPNIAMPVDHPGHVWHQFVIKARDRDDLNNYLHSRSIETQVHYSTCPADMNIYKGYCKTNTAHWLSDHVLSLPVGPHLSKEDIDFVCSAIRDHIRGDVK